MALHPSSENLRAELARFMIRQYEITEVIGMKQSMLSDFLTGRRRLTGWAAHNIGWGINHVTGKQLLAVDMELGLLKPKKGRRPGYQRRRVS